MTRKNYILRSDLAKTLAAKFEMTDSCSDDAINTILNTMINSLADNNRIELREFGVFEIRTKESMPSRNPKTGETIQTPKLYKAHLKTSEILKQKINALAKQKPLA